MRLVVSGTFDPLHDGHRAVLREALRFGDDGVVIGLRSERFAEAIVPEARDLRSYDRRQVIVEEAVETLDDWGRDVVVQRLEDDHGIAGEEPQIDGLVTSPRDASDIEDVNELRRVRGLQPLTGIVAPTAMSEDGEPISSTRIAAGEIDEHGVVLE